VFSASHPQFSSVLSDGKFCNLLAEQKQIVYAVIIYAVEAVAASHGFHGLNEII